MSININDKKKEIINASICLFSNKGFSATSVQDIATHCNISKATIYKLFNSKEEILVNIIKYFNNNMVSTMEDISLDITLNPKEKFITRIYTFLTYFSSKKDFTLTLIKNQNEFSGSIVEQAFNESKTIILNWLKNCIYDYFGEEVENVIWDLTYSLRAFIHEFTHIIILKRVIEKDFNEVAEYIVNAIIYIAERHISEKPLISSESIRFICCNKDFQQNEEFLLTEWGNKIKEIRHTISNSFSLLENTDLSDSVNLLESEFNKTDRKSFLIDALLLYLNNFNDLKTHVTHLRKIWAKLK